jgi:hypothetical protein
MQWFLACLTGAIEDAHRTLSGVIERARYWERLRGVPLNDRRRLVITRQPGIRSPALQARHYQSRAVESLETVEQHRSVALVPHILAHVNDGVRPDPEQVRVERGVVQAAQRHTVLNRRLPQNVAEARKRTLFDI